MSTEILLLILGMALVTYIPRMLPLIMLSSRGLNPHLVRWLEMVPPAVLAALLAQELFLQEAPEGGKVLFLSLSNVYLLAAVPTLAVGWFSRSFFAAVIVGMVSVALLRYAMSNALF